MLENVNVKFNADTSGLKKGIDKAKDSLSSLSKSLGIIGGITGFGILSKKAVGLASDLTEVQNVVDTSFRSMTSQVDMFAKNALTSFGLSELSAKKYASSMGAAFKASGLGLENVTKMSTNLTALIGDMSSFYNKSADMVNADLFSGIISNQIETLRKYGIELSVVNLEAYAMSQGIYKSYEAMTSAEKAALRYNYVLSVTKDAQGDFAKTSGTWANQIRLLSENWNIFLGNMGGMFVNVLTPIITGLNYLLKAINTVFSSCAKLFSIFGGKSKTTAVSSMTKATTGLGNATDNATGLANANTNGTKKNTKAKKDNDKASKESAATFDKFNDITSNVNTSTPDGGTSTTGGSANDGGGLDFELSDPYKFDFSTPEIDTSWIDNLMKKFDELKNNSISEDLTSIFDTAKGIITNAFVDVKPNFESSFRNLFSGLSAIGSVIWDDIVVGIGGGLITVFNNWFATNASIIQQDLSTNLQNIFSGNFNIGDVFSSIASIFSTSIDTAKPAIFDSFHSLVVAAYSVFDTCIYIITDSFDKITSFWSNWIVTNQATLTAALSGFFVASADTSHLFSNIVTDVFNSLKPFWTTWGQDILNIILLPLQTLGDMVFITWNEYVLPIWQDIVAGLKKIWEESLKGLVDNVLGFIGRVSEVFSGLWTVLSPILIALWESITEGFRVSFEGILNIVTPIIQSVIDVVNGIMTTLNGILDFIIGVFTGDWQRAWDGIKDIFKGVWDSLGGILKGVVNIIIGAIETMVNSAIAAINLFIRGLNLLTSAINAVPGVNIPKVGTLQTIKIPRLAKGGLAYGEVNAVVGDNFNARQDPEVISPLSSLKNIMLEALVQKEIITGDNKEMRIILTLDNGETLADMLIDPLNNKAKNAGYAPVFAPI